MTKTCKVAVSLLSANFADMKTAVTTAVDAGADCLHLDIMDGDFVPNLTFGPKMVHDIRPLCTLPLDVHLMVTHPERLIDSFVESGADHITFHYEATTHVHQLLTKIRKSGKKPGISLIPSTPVSAIQECLSLAKIVLVMTVNPGFGGQQIIQSCIDKIQMLDALRKEKGYSFEIYVDGGINRSTAAGARNAGADMLISGSAFFSAQNPAEELLIFKGRAIV